MNFDESYLDSAILADLRKFTELRPEIQQLVGTIAQYKVVLDANVAIADLAYKYKNPHVRQTAIEEAVNSSALVLHAPAWLDEEMTRSAIPKFAAKRMLPEQHLQDLWIAYKEQLVWMETPLSSESTFPAGGDVNDIPYVVLQRSIAAHAILSRRSRGEQG